MLLLESCLQICMKCTIAKCTLSKLLMIDPLNAARWWLFTLAETCSFFKINYGSKFWLILLHFEYSASWEFTSAEKSVFLNLLDVVFDWLDVVLCWWTYSLQFATSGPCAWQSAAGFVMWPWHQTPPHFPPIPAARRRYVGGGEAAKQWRRVGNFRKKLRNRKGGFSARTFV